MSEEFLAISEVARKIAEGKSFERGVLEVYAESGGRRFGYEADRIIRGGRMDRSSQKSLSLGLLFEVSKRGLLRREEVNRLIESYLETKRVSDELKMLFRGVELRVKVMVLAISSVLGCFSMVLKTFTGLLQLSVSFNPYLNPFALCALIATYYSIRLATGRFSLRWLLYSLLAFTVSSYFFSSLVGELPIVGF